MGQKGPRPTPTAILRMRGSKRGIYDRKGEPQPERGRPVCPSHLSVAARGIWKKLIPMLDATGVLTLIDAYTCERYCDTLARWRQCVRFLNKHGPTYEAKNGVIWNYPQVKNGMAYSEALLRIEREVGLTPSARARLVVPETKGKDDGLERFFRKGG